MAELMRCLGGLGLVETVVKGGEYVWSTPIAETVGMLYLEVWMPCRAARVTINMGA